MKFISERRYYLERFLRKIAKYDFLVNSEEFQIFARPNGDIEKLLTKLPKLTTLSIIERIQKATDINDKKYDLTDKERLHNILVEYQFFAKKVIPQMKSLKKNLGTYKNIKISTISNLKVLETLITKYEDLNMKNYVN